MAININDMTINTDDYIVTFDTLLRPHVTSEDTGDVRVYDKVLFSKETYVFWGPINSSNAVYLDVYNEDDSNLADTVNAFRSASNLTLFEGDNVVPYFYNSYDGVWIAKYCGRVSGQPLYLTYIKNEDSGEVLWAVVTNPKSTDYEYLWTIDGTPVNENYTGFSATLDNDRFLSIL